MGHLQRSSGDSKRAMDAYVEALKINPYLWEAFLGLLELGIHFIFTLQFTLGVSLRVENCFKSTSTMRALRESRHSTNIDAPSTQRQAFNLSHESSESSSSAAPTFNWGKPQSAFSMASRFAQPLTPGYP
jgi:hypothetical protein